MTSPAIQPKEISACPLCGKKDRTVVRTLSEAQKRIPGRFTIFRCDHCGLGYVSPRPSDEELVQLYDEPFFAKPNASSSVTERLTQLFFRIRFGRRRRRIERLVGPGTLFDYGCGEGLFAAYMAAHGWEATGFDFSLAAQVLERRITNVRFLSEQSEVDALPEASFDCIMLSQVLEHIPEPLVLLGRLKRLLKPGGILVIAVPNIGSIQAKLAGDRWWGLDTPRHLTHFTPSSLRRTLEAAGLSVVRLDHYAIQTYAPYALYHSLLDRFFTRRHFLSDFFKRALPPDCSKWEIGYNVVALIVLTPILLPFSLFETLISSRLKRSGFIEATAVKPLP